MNRKGFTLVELLAYLCLLGALLGVGLLASKEDLSTSMLRFRHISDNEVFEAAKKYVQSENINSDVCVNVSELILLGYLEYTNDSNVMKKMVQIDIDDSNNLIEKVKYIQACGKN